ncbi:MAG: hypothetical protein NTZ59_10005 [Bacteroidetes bacterium]|jgi:Na+-translocating ferredoxin:NAD+ oxidoreductase RnfG subunit|nr:hypothetical protein [Bacteroidota bacterium]
MKKILKYVLILGIIGAVCGWLFGFYLPTKPWYNDMKAKKGEAMTADSLAQAFKTNEQIANTNFNLKVFDVTGEVKDSKIENGKTTVTLKTTDSTIFVYFALRDSVELLPIAKTITLKGKCTGYLNDGFEGNVQFIDGVVNKK